MADILHNKANRIILCNPRSARRNHRLPISVLQVCASIYGKHDFVIVDGNLEKNTWQKLDNYLRTGEFAFFACSVMPGPQLSEAIELSKAIRKQYPEIIIIWGGYFASIHYSVCIESGLVDYVIRGPGDLSFPILIRCLKDGQTENLSEIANLVFRRDGKTVSNPMDPIPDQDTLPDLPLAFLNEFYPIENYIVKTFMGERTFSYHSSIGCSHYCGFCGVASIYHSGWRGKSPAKMYEDILHLKTKYNINAIEFHDSNFFCSRERTLQFCQLIKGLDIVWWAEGRVDTMNSFADDELKLIRSSGCCLVFMGAETGNNDLLTTINKGPSSGKNQTLEVINRFKSFDIIPQLSLVFGFPEGSAQRIKDQIQNDIYFVRQIKRLNSRTEFVIYYYSPVPFDNSTIYKQVQETGLTFPNTLEEWLKPEWRDFDLRLGRSLPWLKPGMIRDVRNFQVVLLAAFPGISNFHLNWVQKGLLKIPGSLRYILQFYRFPYEIKALLKLFSYQRPEKEGFYST